MSTFRKAYTGLVACVLIWGFPSAARASQVLGINVADLVKAEVAFTGICVSAKSHYLTLPGGESRTIVTDYTFSVPPDGVIKGQVPAEMTFTQWGSTREAAEALGAPFIAGMPYYEQGQRYTLFLTRESAWGLRAPIGLGQGKFNMIQAADGKYQVVNDYGNRSLVQNLPQTKAMTKALSIGGVAECAPGGPGAIDYQKFVNMIKEVDASTSH